MRAGSCRADNDRGRRSSETGDAGGSQRRQHWAMPAAAAFYRCARTHPPSHAPKKAPSQPQNTLRQVGMGSRVSRPPAAAAAGCSPGCLKRQQGSLQHRTQQHVSLDGAGQEGSGHKGMRCMRRYAGVCLFLQNWSRGMAAGQPDRQPASPPLAFEFLGQ